MLKVKNYQFWFCTGSQDLYGDECLSHVAAHSKEIVEKLNASGKLPTYGTEGCLLCPVQDCMYNLP